MNDNELSRRVALIEGWELKDGEWFPSADSDGDGRSLFEPPPYATDWAWCGPLLTKLLHTDARSMEY